MSKIVQLFAMGASLVLKTTHDFHLFRQKPLFGGIGVGSLFTASTG
jgi:hypothetical protein